MDDVDGFELLELLPELQQLRVLKFDSVYVFGDSQPPAAAFSALTASSNLQQLVLDHTGLVDSAWAHVLPSNRQFPQLTELRVEAFIELGDPSALGYTPFSPDGFLRFVKCCPGMRSCTLLHGFSAVAVPQLTALQQLPAAACFPDEPDCGT